MALSGSAVLYELAPAEWERIIAAMRLALLDETRVRVAMLFGSFARGEAFRDVDVAVELDEPFRLLEVGGLANRLWQAAGEPGFDLDVVPMNDAPPSFCRKVCDEGIVLHERHAGDAFEMAVRAHSDAIDFCVAWEGSGTSGPDQPPRGS